MIDAETFHSAGNGEHSFGLKPCNQVRGLGYK